MTKAYPSNLTWEEWELIESLFPEAKIGGRPRTTAMYAVVNAILYVLCEGCTWRGLPGDFPAWSTVYGYFRAWRKDGTWLKVHDKLYQWVRVAAGREPSPSEAAVDSQSVCSDIDDWLMGQDSWLSPARQCRCHLIPSSIPRLSLIPKVSLIQMHWQIPCLDFTELFNILNG